MRHWTLLLEGGAKAPRKGFPAAAGKARAPRWGGAAAAAYVAAAAPRRDEELEEPGCAKERRHQPGVELGCGEQGCTYKLTSTTVLKITQWKQPPTPRAWRVWESEARTGKELGKLGIAPRVYDTFKCRNKGFIIMDMLTPLSKALPGVLTKDARGNTEVHITRFPPEAQHGYSAVLARMVEHGFVHMDNHLGNVGFFAGTSKPLVFDFGFTQRRDRLASSRADQLWAHALSLFIMLEHVVEPLEALEKSVLCQDALAALLGASSGGAAAPGALSLRQVSARLYPAAAINPGAATPKGALAAANKLSASNVDIYAACLAYLALLQLPRLDRYQHALYKLVYDVRSRPPDELAGELAQLKV